MLADSVMDGDLKAVNEYLNEYVFLGHACPRVTDIVWRGKEFFLAKANESNAIFYREEVTFMLEGTTLYYSEREVLQNVKAFDKALVALRMEKARGATWDEIEFMIKRLMSYDSGFKNKSNLRLVHRLLGLQEGFEVIEHSQQRLILLHPEDVIYREIIGSSGATENSYQDFNILNRKLANCYTRAVVFCPVGSDKQCYRIFYFDERKIIIYADWEDSIK